MEDIFESREQVYDSIGGERSPLVPKVQDMDSFALGDDINGDAYQYSFKLTDVKNKEIDVTVHDTQVVIIASTNERMGSNWGDNIAYLPPISLSCMLPIPDDAETHTVKVRFQGNQMIITFARMQNASEHARGRKLFVQSD